MVFDAQGQGYLNSKDVQIQCLFEFEKLKMRGSKKKRINEAQVYATTIDRHNEPVAQSSQQSTTAPSLQPRRTLFGKALNLPSESRTVTEPTAMADSDSSNDDGKDSGVTTMKTTSRQTTITKKRKNGDQKIQNDLKTIQNDPKRSENG